MEYIYYLYIYTGIYIYIRVYTHTHELIKKSQKNILILLNLKPKRKLLRYLTKKHRRNLINIQYLYGNFFKSSFYYLNN